LPQGQVASTWSLRSLKSKRVPSSFLREPLQQRLAAFHHDAGVAAQHLRVAGRQMELAAPDIHPHVVVGDVEIGIARQAEPDHVEQPGDPLIRDLHIDVFEVHGIAEVFRRAIVSLLHVGHSALSPAAVFFGPVSWTWSGAQFCTAVYLIFGYFCSTFQPDRTGQAP
jgi:hypothetical protein